MLAYVLSGLALLSSIGFAVNSQRPPGLTPGTRRMLLDQGNPRVDVNSADATVRAANKAR